MMNQSKTFAVLVLLGVAFLALEPNVVLAQEIKPTATNPPNASAAPAVANTAAGTNAAPAGDAAPPPSEAPKRSAADLEKLVAPIALYPDPLIATVLPASAYPLEIVQAARFVRDTNNLSKLDEQPWDENVKAVAQIPAAISNLDANISWTMELGDAFVNQQKEVMDAIQTMRLKAQKAGTLQTSSQQIVTVTNMVVENVTKEVVEIVPAQPSVIYVPTYNPVTVYYPPYGYVYNPVAPLLTFGAGMAVGAIIANNCNWHGGGVYHNHNDVNINRNVNINNNNRNEINNNRNDNIDNRQQNQNGRQDGRQQNQNGRQDAQNNRQDNRQQAGAQNGGQGGQQWKPDQSRLQKSGATGANDLKSREARGYGESAGQGGNLSQTGRNPNGAGTTPSANRPASGANAGANAGANRPAAGTGAGTGAGASANRPTSGTGAGAGAAANRPATQPASRPASQPASRPATQPSSGGSSAFSGSSSGSAARSSSSRGASSRSTSSGGGAAPRGGGGGGGGRGGGGGGRR
jgi:hypothetical protein